MPRYTRIQTAFVGGEQSPFLAGRIELEQYQFGCRKLRDVTLLPQGGWVRRDGTRLIAKLSSATSGKNYRMWGFTQSRQNKYLLLFEAGKLSIYKGVTKVFEIASASFTESNVSQIDTAQLADTMIITHQDFAPKELRWNGADNNWLLRDITFDFIPKYFFNDANSPAGTPEIQTIELRQTGLGSTFKLALGGFETDEISIQGDGAWNTIATEIKEKLLALTITPSSGIDVVPIGANPTNPQFSDLTFRVTFSGVAADDWPTMSGSFSYRNDRENQYVSVTVTQEGESRKEPVWSNLRGWPKVCAFFENRMILASTRSLPQNIWCSRIGLYYDFNEGDGADSEAINRTIATNINNEIVSIASSRELQVLTTNGEHYNPYAMTPSAFGMPSQTTNGSKPVRPQVINGATYFIQRRGNGVRQFVYTDSENAYNTSSVSLLSEHLIRDVVDTAKTQGTKTDADYLYCLNSDGSIAVMNVLRGQNVLAWSLWETRAGKFTALGSVEEDLYCIILAADGYYLCRFEEEIAMDMAQEFYNTSQITLANAAAYAVAVDGVTDDMHAGDFNPAQPIALNREYEHVEIGVNFTPTCTPNLVADGLQSGNNRYKKKRPVRAWLEMVNAVGIDLVYNGEVTQIAYRTLPLSFANPAPEPFTGVKEVRLMGYSRELTVDIVQTLPFKGACVIALGLEIKTV